MSLKIDFGRGCYSEPDGEPRDSEWHVTVLRTRPIPSARSAWYLDLACGHRAMAFGRLHELGAKVLCVECRDRHAAY